MKFKDWEEFEWFLTTYCNFSCFNCTYGGNNGEPSQFLLFKRTLSMVDFRFMTLCAEWKSDKGKSLQEYEDCPFYALPDKIKELLQSGEMTVTDLRTYGVNYEKFEKEKSG